ncbi:hypothetical protein, partial [Cronobacter sakazakii]|uniref:hypothetical protein n=1 Tax=Cronobacter sakazakii TaxID=28141 RepID=UPI002116642A
LISARNSDFSSSLSDGFFFIFFSSFSLRRQCTRVWHAAKQKPFFRYDAPVADLSPPSWQTSRRI